MTEDEEIEVEVQRRIEALREEELVSLLQETLIRLDVIANRLERTLDRREMKGHG